MAGPQDPASSRRSAWRTLYSRDMTSQIDELQVKHHPDLMTEDSLQLYGSTTAKPTQ